MLRMAYNINHDTLDLDSRIIWNIKCECLEWHLKPRKKEIKLLTWSRKCAFKTPSNESKQLC